MTDIHAAILDRVFERMSRAAANHTSRRSFLARLGSFLVGAAVLPILPVDRTGRMKEAHAATAESFAKAAQTDDPTQCNYWRYCAIDGYMCSCCGGGPSTCPAGTQPSPTSWVGSCINPDDGKTYLIAYRDCCGRDSCARCACLHTVGEMPIYRPQLNNDIIWCFGAPSMVYHCSSAALIGEA